MSEGFSFSAPCIIAVKVVRVGWRAHEGLGRPFEGWACYEQRIDERTAVREWRCIGRAFTWAGARRRAHRGLDFGPVFKRGGVSPGPTIGTPAAPPKPSDAATAAQPGLAVQPTPPPPSVPLDETAAPIHYEGDTSSV